MSADAALAAMRLLPDATHLQLIAQPAHVDRRFCHAGCPSWLNDAGGDCPPHQPIRSWR